MEDDSVKICCPKCNKRYITKIPKVPKLYECKECRQLIVVYPKIDGDAILDGIEANHDVNTKTLSKEYLDIRINGSKFILNEVFDKNKLDEASFKKVGFFTKKLYLPEKGDIIYWSKNGSVNLCDGQIIVYPQLKISDSPNMWATTICLYYNQNKLRKIMFQVWSDKKSADSISYIAYSFIEHFKGIFGLPDVDESKNNIIWQFKDSLFGCKIHPESTAVWFSWVL